MESRPHISVVIPTYGRCASLMYVLRALASQSVSPDMFEVLVICDGDVDDSAGACRQLAHQLPYALRIVEQPNQGPGVARNRGVAEALAPLILFIDDDVVPDERLIETHLRAQAGQELLVTIGPLLPPPDIRLNAWGTWEEHKLCRQYDSIAAGRWQIGWRQFYTGNAAVLKRHILDAGGFDPPFRRAEDIELALRLDARGLDFMFLPEARGWHYVSRSFGSWQHMAEAYGAAEVMMAQAAGRPDLMRTAVEQYRYDRSRLVHAATSICAGRPLTTAVLVALLGMMARVGHIARFGLLRNVACSLIYNARYYHGMACALGGRRMLQGLLHSAEPGFQPEAIVQRLQADISTPSR